MKKIVLPILLGLIAGPLQMGIIWLIIGGNETNNLFVFAGLLLAFIILYKLFLRILYFVTFKSLSLIERDEIYEKTLLICNISFVITYFLMLHNIAQEGVITSIILTFIMMAIQLPFTLMIGGSDDKNSSNSNEKTNDFKFEKAYYKDKFGNIVGTSETTSYKGKYGSYEKTEYKDKFGNVTGKKDRYNF